MGGKCPVTVLSFSGGQALQLILIALEQNGRTMAAGSSVASTLFCIHESVFPFHPLMSY